MTKCTEVRKLLEEVVSAKPTRLKAVMFAINTFLATTETCDAEKAVLVRALQDVLGFLRHYSTYEKDEVAKDEFAYDRLVQHMQQENKSWASAVELALADIPSAAAALLAQGVTLAAVKEYCEKGRSLGDDDVASEVLAIIKGETED
jgi:hypothetical protein